MQFSNLVKARRARKLVVSLAFSGVCLAQIDPGIRGGAPGAGAAIAGLTAGELDFFNNHGVPQFTQVEAVADSLGPRFNLDSCSGCHIHPAAGGSSPRQNNPQVIRASTMAPANTVASFLIMEGPIREVRFVPNPEGAWEPGWLTASHKARRGPTNSAARRCGQLTSAPSCDGRTHDLLQAILARDSPGFGSRSGERHIPIWPQLIA